jgi:hypothetical protein
VGQGFHDLVLGLAAPEGGAIEGASAYAGCDGCAEQEASLAGV